MRNFLRYGEGKFIRLKGILPVSALSEGQNILPALLVKKNSLNEK